MQESGKLYVVATPIGNLEDITLRAIRVLKEVALVAAEDTRRTRKLFDAYSISTPLISLYEHNEFRKSQLLIDRLREGIDVAYVSDAGTPGISDPGFVLIRQALGNNIRVIPVPGVSACITALCISGIPMDSFVFMGFLPSKGSRRKDLLVSLKDESKTMIFYEAPHRLVVSLEDICSVLGNREMVIARELTKLHEEILRGRGQDLLAVLGEKRIKGEITLIVAGQEPAAKVWSDDDLRSLYFRYRKETGFSDRDVVDRMARETGISRKRVYSIVIAAYSAEPGPDRQDLS
ncbi:MAG: Ribosomal RNA small subunit methyltransferase I [Syntrophus sp. PtaU1.Bin208]|nr:MAG: Ribosomal RNA small subunit methyltransferase I [Syntrophus sp. PtaU1.Bin208]